jgi:hypothetical protein
VMLVRYRSGVSGEAARSVHLLPYPVRTGPVSTLCGAVLSAEQVETVAPGQGMPCSLCLLAHLSGLPDPGVPVSPSDADSGAITAATAAGRLSAAALRAGPPARPRASAAARRPALRAGAAQPYGLALPWPPGVHRVSGAVALPPTGTPHGPVSWVCPPADGHPLGLCREIEMFSALQSLGRIGGGS